MPETSSSVVSSSVKNAVSAITLKDYPPYYLCSVCDNNFRNGAVQTALAECNMPCKGNAAEVCGAGGRLNVFWSGKTPPPPPSTVPRVGNWLSIGCVTYVSKIIAESILTQVLQGWRKWSTTYPARWKNPTRSHYHRGMHIGLL